MHVSLVPVISVLKFTNFVLSSIQLTGVKAIMTKLPNFNLGVVTIILCLKKACWETSIKKKSVVHSVIFVLEKKQSLQNFP